MDEDKPTNTDGDIQTANNEPATPDSTGQPARQLVDDVRSPERPAPTATGGDVSASDKQQPEAGNQPEELPPTEDIVQPESTEPQQIDTAPADTASSQVPTDGEEAGVGEPEPDSPPPAESQTDQPINTIKDDAQAGPSEQSEEPASVASAASVPETASAVTMPAKQPGHKAPLGTLIVVVTVVVALIALAVVSYVMVNNASVDENESANSATVQQENEVETPATISQDVEQTTTEIDETLAELDELDATTFDDDSLSDTTLGL